MENTTKFKRYDPDQLFLLPPDMKSWLPANDLVYFIMDVVKRLDLRDITKHYDSARGGQPPYHPQMMVGLLLYAYCKGVASSRKIEQATHHSVPFRVLAANQHPDHDTISEFRQRHLPALSRLFVQVLRLCQKAGLVKLGHVSLDGTKVQANASKHKAMSYGRMEKKAAELKAEVERLLSQAEKVDGDEDALYGKGKQEKELPEELAFKQSRLRKIEEAMQALEEEARAEAAAKRRQQEEKKKEDGDKRKRGRPALAPSEKPESKHQRNFTDPDSRIMKAGPNHFMQGYNGQAAVDAHAQVVVVSHLTQEPNDKQQLRPVLDKMKEHIGDLKPKMLSADSGYFSENNSHLLAEEGIDGYLATGKHKHGEKPPLPPRGRIPKNATIKERMSRKLRTLKGKATYSKRKHIVEPVFGQIKEERAFRRFSFRGYGKCRAEWDLVCLTHNLLKLFRSGWCPQTG
jgi:transposase